MNIQFKKGALELCVLSLLAKRDYYGYELVDALEEGVDIAEGSVYPLLRRLKEDGLVDTYLQESSGGPPRKYYRITGQGLSVCHELSAEWKAFVAAVARIMEEKT